jgi:hypothetical protein
LGDAHGSGQSFTALASDSAGVHEDLSELESIPLGLANSRLGLLCIRTDSQTRHSGVWDSFHRLDDDRTLSGFLSGPVGSLSSLFSVIGDEMMPNKIAGANAGMRIGFMESFGLGVAQLQR